MKALIAEDEKIMAKTLAELLRLEGWEPDICHNGNDALAAALENIYDVIILDIMMPGLNGLEIARRLRENGISTPVLMLTAKSDTDDKVTGLDSGADDYLTKPFETKELLARIRALCRRTMPVYDDRLRFGDVELNVKSSTLLCSASGRSVRLSDKERRIIEYLIINKDQILTREQIALKIWGYENSAEYNNVEVYISFTRKKLAFIGSSTEIKAVRGIGYELRCSDV